MDALAACLKEHEDRLLVDLDLPPRSARMVFADLFERYAAADRHYHTPAHLVDLLDWLDRLTAPATPSGPLRLAAWFHDAVYDSRAADNEERSAELARALLDALGVPAGTVAETARLILLTKTHTTSDADGDGLFLLDADLSILGAEPVVYDAYAAAVRREYAWVPEEDWRSGRLRVLEHFLGRERIYRTERLRREREEAARANLRREMLALVVANVAIGKTGEVPPA